ISGLLLLATGVILLLTNLGVIDFSWRNSIRFWPLIIVYYGVSMVLPRNTTGRGLSTLFAIASIAFVIYVGVNAEAANRIYRVVDPFSSSNRLTERLIEKLDHLDSVEAFIDLQSTTTFPAEKMNASERAALFEQINYLKADLQF